MLQHEINKQWAEKAEAFHHQNPHVVVALIDAAREVAQTKDRIGMSVLFGKLRWDHAISTTGDEFKLNDGFQAWYTRLVMRLAPDVAHLFRPGLRKAA